MDENDLRDKYERTFGFLNAIIEFGVLLLQTLIVIPTAIILGIFFLSIPALILIFAFQLPLYASIYVFLVYGGVGAYSVHRYLTRHDRDDDSTDGRSVYDDDDHIPSYSSIRRR